MIIFWLFWAAIFGVSSDKEEDVENAIKRAWLWPIKHSNIHIGNIYLTPGNVFPNKHSVSNFWLWSCLAVDSSIGHATFADYEDYLWHFSLKFWHFSKQFKTTHGIVTWSRVCSDLAIVFGGHCHTKLCVFLSEETWRHLANMQIMYYNINVAPRAKFQFFWHIVKASLTLIFENVDVSN